MNDLPEGYRPGSTLEPIDANPASRWRPLRAGLVTLGAGSAFCAAVRGLFSARCTSDQTNPYGCLGGQLLAVAIGVPVILVVVALALAGRGFLHSVAGSIASMWVGWEVVNAVFKWLDMANHDFLGLTLVALLTAGCAAIWAAYAPATCTTHQTQRPPR